MGYFSDLYAAASDLYAARVAVPDSQRSTGYMPAVDRVDQAQHALTDALFGRGYDQRAETAEAVADARAAAEEARADEDASHYDTSDDSDVDENVADFSD